MDPIEANMIKLAAVKNLIEKCDGKCDNKDDVNPPEAPTRFHSC